MAAPIVAAVANNRRTRSVSSQQKSYLKGKLIAFKKSLLVELLQQSSKGQLPVSSVPELLIGFSDNQISQVMDNSDKIHSITDVKTFVEIWKEKHANAILGRIS